MGIQALNAGLQGIQTGLNNLRNDANDIAQAGNPNPAAAGDAPRRPELAESLVNLKVDTRQVEASAEVVKAADEVLGTLLDERV